jgi:hypothetical protein
LSSAILYVAIVAIWACVLIPRWLRRDPPADQAPDEAAAGRAPGQAAGRAADEAAAGRVGARDAADQAAQGVPGDGAPSRDRRVREDRPPGAAAHARVLSARRRLLGMLLVLTAGSGALAYTRLAAWWVVVPPSVMLLGYLALLRAAANADAERRELQRAAAARPPARRGLADRRGPVTGGARAGAAVIRIPASHRPVQAPGGDRGDTELYDQYADAKLRAVGD